MALGFPSPGPWAQKLWPGLRVTGVLPHQGSQGKMGHGLRGARVLGLSPSHKGKEKSGDPAVTRPVTHIHDLKASAFSGLRS